MTDDLQIRRKIQKKNCYGRRPLQFSFLRKNLIDITCGNIGLDVEISLLLCYNIKSAEHV